MLMRKTYTAVTVSSVTTIVREELKRTGLDKVPDRLNTLETKMDTLETKMDKVAEVLDGVAGEIKNYRDEQELNAHKLSEHTDELEELDLRLNKLEKQSATQTV